MPSVEADEALRKRFFQAASDAFAMPDPVGSLTVAAVAKRSGIPGSTILDQVDEDAHPDGPMNEFRRLVFHELIRRVQPAPIELLQQLTIAGLRQNTPLPTLIADLVDSTAEQFRSDPSTRFLLAAASRAAEDPNLAAVATATWATLTDPVVRIIELLIAARGFQVIDGVERPHLSELLAVAFADAAVWDTVMHVPPRNTLLADGLSLSPPALFVWSTLRPLLATTDDDTMEA